MIQILKNKGISWIIRTVYKNLIHVNSDRLLIPNTVKYLKTIMLKNDAYDYRITKIFIKNPIQWKLRV